MTVRVLVVDDSPSFRALARTTIASTPDLVLAGEAADGHEGVERAIELRPDVVVMDLHMPGVDGLEATRRIMDRVPSPVVLVSASRPADALASACARGAGAVTALEKPPGLGHPGHDAAWRALWRTVRSMSGVRVVRRWDSRTGRTPAGARRAEVVALAASTGGPAALATILAGLPTDLGAPVLIVQHLASGFVPALACWLDRTSALPTKVAEDGEPLLPGHAYLAPTERHLQVDPRTRVARLVDGPRRGGFRPSASVLFESVAHAWGEAALGVILTGMGRDGVEGLRVLRLAGGCVVAQDEPSSIVHGMPGAVVREGLADHVLGLGSIAAFVARAVRGAR